MLNTGQNQPSSFGFAELLITSWVALRDNWLTIFTAGFIRDLLALLAGGIAFTLSYDLRLWNLLIAFIVRSLVWSALQPGYLKLCLNVTSSEPAKLIDIFSKMALGPHMLFAVLLFVLAVLLGATLLILPGLFLAVMFSLFGFVLIDRTSNALNALTESFRMLRKRGWYAAGCIATAIAIGYFLPLALEPLVLISLATLYARLRRESD